MPAYDYQCKACECRFERRQKMSDPLIEVCPECGGAVQRLIGGGAGAITKGAGNHSAYPAAGSACGMGGMCGGQGGGGCRNKSFCD
jgi:putative FmdB family regulatory protein